MQTIIVIVIVCLAALFLLKTFIGKSGSRHCRGCGCAGCPTAGTCEDKEKP